MFSDGFDVDRFGSLVRGRSMTAAVMASSLMWVGGHRAFLLSGCSLRRVPEILTIATRCVLHMEVEE
jgi:hypothetical protein